MSRSPQLSPRKTPRQQRSRQMVTRIVDAAGRVLAERGYEGASTHRIAAEAGISGGSLYQYFANKDAVVAAVLEQFSTRLTARLEIALSESMTMGWREAGRVLLVAQFEVFEENIGPLRTIIERAAHLGGTHQLDAMHRRMSGLTRMYLVAHRDQFRPDLDIEASVWIMVEVSAQLAIRYVVHPPSIPRERIIDQLTEMFISHLSPQATEI
jgi:AcrR family transcriptional regulator